MVGANRIGESLVIIFNGEFLIYDVNAGAGEPKYSYVLPFTYPRTHPIPVDTMPQKRFKQDFFDHLATEIAMRHIRHKDSLEVEEGK